MSEVNFEWSFGSPDLADEGERKDVIKSLPYTITGHLGPASSFRQGVAKLRPPGKEFKEIHELKHNDLVEMISRATAIGAMKNSITNELVKTATKDSSMAVEDGEPIRRHWTGDTRLSPTPYALSENSAGTRGYSCVKKISHGYKLELLDSGGLLLIDPVGDNLLIRIDIPENSEVRFPIGTRINILTTSTFAVRFQAIGGVNLQSTGHLPKKEFPAEFELVKTGVNMWAVLPR